MCTAIYYRTDSPCFGRNLDLEYRYDERVVITPRDFPFKYLHTTPRTDGYAMIGTATVIDGHPLYYDAANEHGLAMAGLSFAESCVFKSSEEGKIALATFELIPYILTSCKSTCEAAELLGRINLTDDKFSGSLPAAKLHFMLADADGCIVAEPLEDGFKIYENTIGVLTNEPPFDRHLASLENYLHLSAENPPPIFMRKASVPLTSRGIGGVGLPGDFSSRSRFIKAAFCLSASVKKSSEAESIAQFFHILDSVCQVEGCVAVGNSFEKTQYSSCINLTNGDFYFKTYDNPNIYKIPFKEEYRTADSLVIFPLFIEEDFAKVLQPEVFK